VRLVFAPHASTVHLFCQVPHKTPPTLEHQLAALYPDCTIRRLPHDALAAPMHCQPWKATLRLHPDIFPIRRYTQFEDPLNRNAADPLTGLLVAVQPTKNGRLRSMIEIAIRPARGRRCHQARRAVERLAGPFFRSHPRLARFYVTAIACNCLLVRLVGRLFGACLARSHHRGNSRELTTTSSRAHDREHPLAFNPLATRFPEQRPLVASGIVSAFKKLYGESWGPRLEHILRNALLALLENPGTSLLSLVRLLSDPRYRNEAVSRLQDPVVRSFWQNEFAKWKPNFRAEAIAPIQNKVGQFLSHPILRPILSQPRNKVDFRRIMDEGQILIVNLSKGRIGEDASTLLGSLLVTGLQLAAMSRADVPEDHRPDFFLYVDEFQNFATESFATILSEARKYRLNLTLANQYLAQMDEQTLEAVFGNVGSLLCFQIGARDAESLAEQLGGDLTPQDLMALPKYTAYIRLLVDGMPSRPFSMQTLPPRVSRNTTRSETIRKTSRHRYARPIKEVEHQIERTIGCP